MNEIVFIAVSGCWLSCFLLWGFKYLPGERWQMLAIVPNKKHRAGHWHGTNLTYYGFFIATSQLLSISLLLILLGAMNISLPGTILSTVMVLLVCIPAARVIARIVEKKQHTFTIGGASFVGIILAPWAVIAAEKVLGIFTECYLPLMPVLAAMAIAYALGEGLGRLACLSYGCCYGKPLKDCSKPIQILFKKTGTVFRGTTKKAQYESRLEGERLVPVQVITCILYTLTALVGSWLFLRGYVSAAFLLAMSFTQIWRFFSEMLRADFRGFGKISVYQKMGILAVVYSFILVFFHHSIPLQIKPNIVNGLTGLWNPAIILGLQLFWGLIFIYFGRSTVTTSTVSFSLIEERI